MQEYGNFYSKEDLGWNYPPTNYEVMRFIGLAQQKFPTDRESQRNWLEEKIKTYFWPTDITDVNVLSFAGLLDRQESIMINKEIFSKYHIDISNNCYVDIKAFYEEGHIWFYWWDLYLNDKRSSAIEFFPWRDDPVSYVLFATNENQTPLLCMKTFVDAKIRKYNTPNLTSL